MALSAHASQPDSVVIRRDETLVSAFLNRPVRLDIILPPGYSAKAAQAYPVLYLNDGQDLPRLRMKVVLDSLYRQRAIQPFVVVAIHAGERIQEYGIAAEADYLKRGAKAGVYRDFVVRELLPYVQRTYGVSRRAEEAVFAGFSLGGLSAFDLVWNQPQLFGRAGVFSGSFWWRSRALDQGYTDADRIMHRQVRTTAAPKQVRFWLQTGTLDETSDRDKDGVIDSIDDTLDLVAELERKGFRWGKAVTYVEVKGGRHDPETWGQIMPSFLLWAFGR